IAASFTWSGVSKSGSPAPRPIISLPCALSSATLPVSATVGDGLIRERASEMKATIIPPVFGQFSTCIQAKPLHPTPVHGWLQEALRGSGSSPLFLGTNRDHIKPHVT